MPFKGLGVAIAGVLIGEMDCRSLQRLKSMIRAFSMEKPAGFSEGCEPIDPWGQKGGCPRLPVGTVLASERNPFYSGSMAGTIGRTVTGWIAG